METRDSRIVCLRILFLGCILFLTSFSAVAQQLLGSIEGTVTDPSGAAIPEVQVKAVNLDTNLELSTKTNNAGFYRFFNLPTGRYSVTFSKSSFRTETHQPVSVLANRTTTEEASLKVGSVTEAVQVTASNQLNQVDTTNGYVLGENVIQNTPLPTGSFTQLATLSPGVNADLAAGSGSNSGLGNQAIWANGQRDSSNSFTLNAISGNNLFNGKTTSQVSSNRFSLSTGENFNNSTGEIGTATSVYDAIGQALPTPPVETIEELRVNTSMYDASQGANSGAHIGILTKSGTNQYHGQVYEYFQNSFWNARPFFYRLNTVIPGSPSVPPLHYNRFGATFGGPVFKNKLFFFTSYQGIRVSDQSLGTSQVNVPMHLTSDRSAPALINVASQDFGASVTSIDPVALALMNAKNKDGSFFIPNPQITDPNLAAQFGYDAIVQGAPSRFHADQANFNLDYNASPKDRLAAKYYYQHTPTTNAFASQGGAQSSSGGGLLGFPQQLDSGSQTISLDNTVNLSAAAVWEQRIGFVHEKAFAHTGQPFTPQQFGINLFGSNRFPGFLIDSAGSGNFSQAYAGSSFQLAFGPVSNFANAGMFQNRYTAASDFNWVHGRHNFAFGFNWDKLQLNIHNQANQVAFMEFFDFPGFLTAQYRTGQEHSAFFNGTTNRHYRANEAGAYAQDNIKVSQTLNVTVGLRFDWDGPLSEKNGLLTNFDSARYSYDLATDTINNIGLVVAGNNRTFPTKGVSDSTLTGRQWGFAPRIGAVWSPSKLRNVVFRTGFGIFYDRGQFFTEYSPSAGFGFNGPFGVTLEPPFTLPTLAAVGNPLSAPYGTNPPTPPPQDLSQVIALVPNKAGLISGTNPFLFGGYDPRNKLPYSENWTLDMQWQPRQDTVVSIGYAGNHGVHLTEPIPFNQPQIATAGHPVNGETSSYGYQPIDHSDPAYPGCFNSPPCPTLVSEPNNTSTGGNTDLRAPYLGFSPNSVFWTANAISNYNALLIGVTKRMTHGFQVTGSYTWSHTLDEQSGLGLFYNGNNPLEPRTAYASSDFDRTHVASFSVLYEMPKFQQFKSFAGKLINGWGLSSLMVFESGQPYNVYDFSGSLGSLYYSANDFLTNPVVPLAPGRTPNSAKIHGNAALGTPYLDPNAFVIPQLQPGQLGVPPCGPTTDGFNQNFCDTVENDFSSGGRNVFRGPFQARVDLSVMKNTKLSERFNLKYSADFFNVLNHASFDTPNNNVTFNPCFNPDPCYTFPPSGSLGVIQHTLGGPRIIQMSLHLEF